MTPIDELIVKELRERVCNSDSINKFYRNMPRDKWIFNRKDSKIVGELWRECRAPYLYNDKKVEASNLGRIMINGKIVVPIDEKGDFGGYLKIKEIDEYVYDLVANAWLNGDKKAGFVTHHISDDGYDNRPENLMYLRRGVHNAVHRGNKPPATEEYKCPIYK